MGEYHQGRALGVHKAGESVEMLQISYEKEIEHLETRKSAFETVGKGIDGLKYQVRKDLADGKLTSREAQVAEIYLKMGIDLMKTFYNDTEANRLKAVGALKALQDAVVSVKQLYDSEQRKANEIEDYESIEPKTPEIVKTRPTGANPGEPIKDFGKDGNVEKPRKRTRTKKTKGSSENRGKRTKRTRSSTDG
jgi:hypothetical protein